MLKYHYITSDSNEYRAMLEALKLVDTVVLDVETTGLDPYSSDLILVQLKVGNEIYIINVKIIDNNRLTRIFNTIKNLNLLVVGHNVKFDVKFIATKTGILLENLYDTLIAESIVTAGLSLYSSLQGLHAKYLNKEIDKDVRDLFSKFDGNITQEMLVYSAIDVDNILDIRDKQLEIIEETNQTKVLELEMKLLPAVCSMELTGVSLDVDYWREVLAENILKVSELNQKILQLIWNKYLSKEQITNALDMCKFFNISDRTKTKKDVQFLQELTAQEFIKNIFFERFNTGSSTQLLKAFPLFEINLDSTNAKVLDSFIKDNELDESSAELLTTIVEYREFLKKVSSYGEKFLENINPVTNKIHSNFMQIGTQTGRWSSSSPNLQNIPADERYRHCFVASDGYKFITSDYSQQELRIAGAVAGEVEIINAYKNNLDIHTSTASAMFGVDYNDVEKSQRQFAKTINFAILYGTTVYGLAFNLKITKDKAQELLDRYFAQYKILAIFKKFVEDKIWEKLYSVTMLGRRRAFEKTILFGTSRDADRYEQSVKREGFNAIIQGSAADMMKLAIVYMYHRNPFGDKFRLLMQVHDEVVVEVHEAIVEQAKDFIGNCMVDAGKQFLGDIPVEYSSEVANYWSK